MVHEVTGVIRSNFADEKTVKANSLDVLPYLCTVIEERMSLTSPVSFRLTRMVLDGDCETCGDLHPAKVSFFTTIQSNMRSPLTCETVLSN